MPRSTNLMATALATCLATVAGCGLEAVSGTPFGALLPQTLTFEEIVGVDDDSILVSRTRASLTQALVDPNAPTDATTTLVRVARDSLAATSIGTFEGTFIREPVSDGTWIAWVGIDDRTLRVLNVDTGAQADYADPNWGYFQPVNITNNQLLIEFDRRIGSGAILVNLVTGEQTPVITANENIFGEDLARIGDSLIWLVFPPLIPREPTIAGDDIVILPIPAPDNRGRIEQIPLDGSDPTTLAEEIGFLPSSSSFVETASGLLGWASWSDDFSKLQLETLDLTSGARNIVAQFDDDGGVSYELDELGPYGALVTQTTEPEFDENGGFLGASAAAQTYLAGWDGTMQLVLRREQNVLQIGAQVTTPRQIGNLVIIRDTSGEFVIFDPMTSTERRFRPFDQ